MKAKHLNKPANKKKVFAIAGTAAGLCAIAATCWFCLKPAPAAPPAQEAAAQSVIPTAVVEEVPAATLLKLICSSSELDLNVEVRNDQDELVTGYPFAVTVTPAAGGAIEAVDDDENGEISLTDLTDGIYTVTLAEAEGYEVPDPVEATVEPKVVYEVVDVTDKVVSSAEVDSAAEDGSLAARAVPATVPTHLMPPLKR